MEYFTAKDVAKELGISRRRVIQLAQSRRVGGQLSSGAWVFTKADLEKLKSRSPGRPAKVEENLLTKSEFEGLLTTAVQHRESSQQPDSKEKGKSVEHLSDDCSDNHIHPDSLQGT